MDLFLFVVVVFITAKQIAEDWNVVQLAQCLKQCESLSGAVEEVGHDAHDLRHVGV